MSILDSLASGGYTIDNDFDFASDFDLWVEEKEAAAEKMSLDELYIARFNAQMGNDDALASIYDAEIDKRNPVINISGYSTLQSEPYQYNPEEEDRRKEWLENYAADELPL